MAGRGGGGGQPGGNGYEPYDYTHDYGQDSSGSHGFVSESWLTSYSTPSFDGTTQMGPSRDGHYGWTYQQQYGYSGSERSYESRREQHLTPPTPLAWSGGPRGSFRGNFGSSASGRGSGHPMPLFSPGSFPEMTGFQGLRAFTGNSYFGGGFKQRTKKGWRERLANRRITAEEESPPVKKSRQTKEESREKSEESDLEREGDAEAAEKSTKTNEGGEGEETGKEEKGTAEHRPTPVRKNQELQGRRLRDRMVERIQFVCSLCKFRTFYDEEMSHHLKSDFHKDHFRYVGGKLPKQSADFLQEYVLHKTKKTEERRAVIEDLSASIQQIYRDQDLTQGLEMEHFIKKVEAAHCAACDIFIPMNLIALQRHLRSPLHNQNRRSMMENSKKTALAVARSILSNQMIHQKLERYIKGQNPFTDDHNEIPGNNSVGSDPGTEEKKNAVADDCASEKNDLPSCSSTEVEGISENTTSQERCGENEEEDVTEDMTTCEGSQSEKDLEEVIDGEPESRNTEILLD